MVEPWRLINQLCVSISSVSHRRLINLKKALCSLCRTDINPRQGQLIIKKLFNTAIQIKKGPNRPLLSSYGGLQSYRGPYGRRRAALIAWLAREPRSIASGHRSRRCVRVYEDNDPRPRRSRYSPGSRRCREHNPIYQAGPPGRIPLIAVQRYQSAHTYGRRPGNGFWRRGNLPVRHISAEPIDTVVLGRSSRFQGIHRHIPHLQESQLS